MTGEIPGLPVPGGGQGSIPTTGTDGASGAAGATGAGSASASAASAGTASSITASTGTQVSQQVPNPSNPGTSLVAAMTGGNPPAGEAWVGTGMDVHMIDIAHKMVDLAIGMIVNDQGESYTAKMQLLLSEMANDIKELAESAADKRFAAAVSKGALTIAAGATQVGFGSVGAYKSGVGRSKDTEGLWNSGQAQSVSQIGSGISTMMQGLGDIVSAVFSRDAEMTDATKQRIESSMQSLRQTAQKWQEEQKTQGDIFDKFLSMWENFKQMLINAIKPHGSA